MNHSSLIDRAVGDIVATTPDAPTLAEIMSRRVAPRPRRPMVPLLAGGGLIAASAVGIIVFAPNRGDGPDTNLVNVSDSVASTTLPPTTTVSPSAATFAGAALPTWLPDGMAIWGITLYDGVTEHRFIGAVYSEVDIADSEDPFARMVRVSAVPTDQSLDELLAQRIDESADLGFTYELVPISGEGRVVGVDPSGHRVVEWINDGRRYSVSDRNALNETDLEQLIAGITFADFAATEAALADVDVRIDAMPLIASGPLDGEVIEVHALEEYDARALCVTSAAGRQHCELIVNESSMAGNPGSGDAMWEFPAAPGRLRIYGWISVPATVIADHGSPITQTVVNGATWFRVDVSDAPGEGANITIEHAVPVEPGQFVLRWGIGEPPIPPEDLAAMCADEPTLQACQPTTTG